MAVHLGHAFLCGKKDGEEGKAALPLQQGTRWGRQAVPQRLPASDPTPPPAHRALGRRRAPSAAGLHPRPRPSSLVRAAPPKLPLCAGDRSLHCAPPSGSGAPGGPGGECPSPRAPPRTRRPGHPPGGAEPSGGGAGAAARGSRSRPGLLAAARLLLQEGAESSDFLLKGQLPPTGHTQRASSRRHPPASALGRGLPGECAAAAAAAGGVCPDGGVPRESRPALACGSAGASRERGGQQAQEYPRDGASQQDTGRSGTLLSSLYQPRLPRIVQHGPRTLDGEGGEVTLSGEAGGSSGFPESQPFCSGWKGAQTGAPWNSGGIQSARAHVNCCAHLGFLPARFSGGGRGPGTQASGSGEGGGRAAEGGQSTRPQRPARALLVVVGATQTKQHARGPGGLGEPSWEDTHLRQEGLRAASAPPSVPPPRVRPGGSGSVQTDGGGGARHHRARERAPGGTRKRRASPGLRARAARAPPWARAGGESAAGAVTPGGDRAQATTRGGPAKGASERASGQASDRESRAGAAAGARGAERGRSCGAARGPGQGERGWGDRPGGAQRSGRQTPGRAAPPPSLPGREAASVAEKGVGAGCTGAWGRRWGARGGRAAAVAGRRAYSAETVRARV
ncbi:collagen alpha-1(III) chain-like [Cynocephalus volans]|uniref:collagen alpha-1(III) chain-like n=1 Tax=Cynocephalus volans TaxID=110931 RepID=UPI002FC90ACA